VFEKRILREMFGPKRYEMTGEGRKVHNKEHHNMFSSPNIIRMVKSKKMRWAGHVSQMGENRNAYMILLAKPDGKRPLGRLRHRWVNDIKIDLREIEWGDKDWIDPAQDRDQWRALVNTVIKLMVL
jgi:hypothetical protein